MKIGIAGAGLLGRLLAWQWSKAGHTVHLFEKGDDSGHSSAGWIAAGMLSVEAEIETISPELYSEMQKARGVWLNWIADLSVPVDLRCNGSLLVAHRRDEQELKRFSALLHRASSSDNRFELCDRATLQLHEPQLSSTVTSGMWLPHEGAIDTEQLYVALTQAMNDCGVIWKTHAEVISVKPHNIVTEHASNFFDWAIDCRGIGAIPEFPGLRGVRGELIKVHAPEVELTHPIRLLHPRYPVYIVPRRNHCYVLGASEIEGSDVSAVSVRTTLELLSAAYSVHSGFSEARVLAMQTGIRPALWDHQPGFRYAKGLLRINGLYRHGYTLTPYCFQQASQFMTNGMEAVLHPQSFTEEFST